MYPAGLIRITDSEYSKLACGSCKSILLGYDEEICPSCGALVDMDKVIEMSSNELDSF